MRTEKEILLIAKDCLQNQKVYLDTGLCMFVTDLINQGFIGYGEYNFLWNTIIKYEVPLNKRPIQGLAYYFEPGKIEPRVEYLNQLIKMHHENFFIRNFWRFVYRKNFI